MIVALLLVIVVTLLFGAPIVRRLISRSAGIAVLIILGLVIVSVLKLRYDRHVASERRDQDVELAQRTTLEAVSRDIKQPLSSLLDVTAFTADDDFEVCGTISGTSGYGGADGRQRWISNGGGRFEYEKPGDKYAFDDRVALLCTSNHMRAAMEG